MVHEGVWEVIQLFIFPFSFPSCIFHFTFVLFSILAVLYGIILHMTNFGRAVYAIGNNPTGALFSGIRVNRVKFILFLFSFRLSRKLTPMGMYQSRVQPTVQHHLQAGSAVRLARRPQPFPCLLYTSDAADE